MIKRILLSDAREGMVLARGVANDKGMTLSAGGTPLTEELIQRFGQMEITDVYIKDEAPLSEEDYRALRETIEQRFALSHNPFSLLGRLKTVLLKRLASQKGSV